MPYAFYELHKRLLTCTYNRVVATGCYILWCLLWQWSESWNGPQGQSRLSEIRLCKAIEHI